MKRLRLYKKSFQYLKNFMVVYKSLKTHEFIPPKQITLELTYRCNAKCIFCDRWKTSKEEIKKELNINEIKQLIQSLAEVGTQNICLTGGEPLLKENFFEIVDEIKKHKIEVTVTDNGLLLPKFAKKFAEHKIDHVMISMDSANPEKHDSIRGIPGIWKNAVEGIKLLKKYNVPVGITNVVVQNNADEVEKIIKFAKDLDIYFVFQPVHDDTLNKLSVRDKKILFSEKDIKRLEKIMKSVVKKSSFWWVDKIYYKLFPMFLTNPEKFINIKCPVAGRTIYFIDPYGNVYPCESRRDLRLGNVRKKGFKEIISSKKAIEIRKKLYSDKRNCVCWYRCVAPDIIMYQFPPHLLLPRLGNPIVKNKWKEKIKEIENC